MHQSNGASNMDISHILYFSLRGASFSLPFIVCLEMARPIFCRRWFPKRSRNRVRLLKLVPGSTLNDGLQPRKETFLYFGYRWNQYQKFRDLLGENCGVKVQWLLYRRARLIACNSMLWPGADTQKQRQKSKQVHRRLRPRVALPDDMSSNALVQSWEDPLKEK